MAEYLRDIGPINTSVTTYGHELIDVKHYCAELKLEIEKQIKTVQSGKKVEQDRIDFIKTIASEVIGIMIKYQDDNLGYDIAHFLSEPNFINIANIENMKKKDFLDTLNLYVDQMEFYMSKFLEYRIAVGKWYINKPEEVNEFFVPEVDNSGETYIKDNTQYEQMPEDQNNAEEAQEEPRVAHFKLSPPAAPAAPQGGRRRKTRKGKAKKSKAKKSRRH